MLASVIRAVDAALLLWPGRAAQRANEHDVRIFWVNEDACDPSCVIESSVRPYFPGIERDIHTITHDIAIADGPGLPSAHPYYAWIGRSDCNRSNCGGRLFIKNWLPTVPAIRGLPHTAGCGARIIGAWVPGDSNRGGDSIPSSWPNKSKSKTFFVFRWSGWLLGICGQAPVHSPKAIIPAFRQEPRIHIFLPLLELAVSKSQERQQLARGEIEFARMPDYVYCMHDETSTPWRAFSWGDGPRSLNSTWFLDLSGLRAVAAVVRAIWVCIIRRAEKCKVVGDCESG